jgi:2'-5' RNA ligase
VTIAVACYNPLVQGTQSGKRLFVAVNLSISSTRRLVEAIDRLARAGGPPDLSWVPPANLHVTLKFLGWTHDEAWRAVRDRLRVVALAHRPFDLEASGGGAFPDATSARVLWAGVRDPSGGLGQLSRAVDDAMVGLGFAPEPARPFVPHVTLGRVRGAADCTACIEQLSGQTFGTSRIREISLYESEVKSRGSEYNALARVHLGAPSPTTERQSGSVELRAPQEEPTQHGRDGSEGVGNGERKSD